MTTDQQPNNRPSTSDDRNNQLGLKIAVLPFAMLGLAYAAVPLYAMFCQVTGYGGTTQRVVKPSDTVIERSVKVLFDANVSSNLPWKFEPVQRTIDVKLGETALAFYRATNTSDKVVRGTAAFNVDPPAAGIHFNKIACFCFTEQSLNPGESVDMPVTFYVDPALATDKDASAIKVIVLSYTFFPMTDTKAAAATPAANTPPVTVPAAPLAPAAATKGT